MYHGTNFLIAVKSRYLNLLALLKFDYSKWTKTSQNEVMQPKTSNRDSKPFFLLCPQRGRFWQSLNHWKRLFTWAFQTHFEAPFLILSFSYYTFMTFLMMLPVILLSMLMRLFSILSIIMHLICGNIVSSP